MPPSHGELLQSRSTRIEFLLIGLRENLGIQKCLQKTWTLYFKRLKNVDPRVHVLRFTFWVHVFLWTFNFCSRSSRNFKYIYIGSNTYMRTTIYKGSLRSSISHQRLSIRYTQQGETERPDSNINSDAATGVSSKCLHSPNSWLDKKTSNLKTTSFDRKIIYIKIHSTWNFQHIKGSSATVWSQGMLQDPAEFQSTRSKAMFAGLGDQIQHTERR